MVHVIMVHKPREPANETSSYRPIGVLPVLSNIFEIILLSGLLQIILTQYPMISPDFVQIMQ